MSNVTTAREVYMDILTELVKEETPILYLDDYLYFYNKAISEYNKARYELFEVNQQLSDDLRAWKKIYKTQSTDVAIADIGSEVTGDRFYYRHLVGCSLGVTLLRPVAGCDQSLNTTKRYKVTRMSSGIKNGILNNAYLDAQFFRPYFEITDNRVTIDVGDVNTKYIKISDIEIEYLKQPERVVLTEEQIADDSVDDPSQVLEFSRDVSDEITKIALKLILERGANPRLQSHVAVNQSISDFPTGLKG